jgi:transcriptional regulator with XRE-family HTH domain
MDISNQIRLRIARDSRTQKEIANAAGVHPTSLSRWLNGRADANSKTLDALSRVLDLEIKPRQTKTPKGKRK